MYVTRAAALAGASAALALAGGCAGAKRGMEGGSVEAGVDDASAPHLEVEDASGPGLDIGDAGAGAGEVDASVVTSEPCGEQAGGRRCLDNTPQRCRSTDHGWVWHSARECSGELPACMGGVCQAAVVDVIARDLYTCALRSTGQVKCWGDGTGGVLGLGDVLFHGDGPGEMGDNLPPVDLGEGRRAAVIDGDFRYMCAALVDGGLKCWGVMNGDVRVGDEPGEMGDALPLMQLGADEPIEDLRVIAAQTCVVFEGGDLKCWDATQLDDPFDASGVPVVDFEGGAQVEQIASTGFHQCALLEDGTLRCWGRNDFGQLGLGDTMDRDLPTLSTQVNVGARKVVQVSAFAAQTCVVLDDGTATCWGLDENIYVTTDYPRPVLFAQGELGLDPEGNRGDEPGEMGIDLATLDLIAPADEISTRGTTCVRLRTGEVQCFGIGSWQAVPERPGPAVDLGYGRTATAISASPGHTCAVLDTGQLKCWGINGRGQLGLGDNEIRGDDPDEMGENLPEVDLGSG